MPLKRAAMKGERIKDKRGKEGFHTKAQRHKGKRGERGKGEKKHRADGRIGGWAVKDDGGSELNEFAGMLAPDMPEMNRPRIVAM